MVRAPRLVTVTLILVYALMFPVVAETYILLPPDHHDFQVLNSPLGYSPSSHLKEGKYIGIAGVYIANLTEDAVLELKSLGWRAVRDYNVSLAPYRIDGFFVSNGTPASSYWNLRWIEADRVWKLGINGSGVKVAVIDTGVALHPDLKGKIVAWKDFVNGRGTPYDDNGHGTHVAGIIAGKKTGVAPGSQLLVAKVFDTSGTAPLSRILQAFQWAVENGADVISYSAGLIHVDKFSGKGQINSNNSTVNHTFQVRKFRAEEAFKPSAVIIYVSPQTGGSVSVSLMSPEGKVNLSEMDWLETGDNAWYFTVGGNFTAKKYVLSYPLASGNWTLRISANINESPQEVTYTYTVLVIYQSDGSSVLDRAVNGIVSNGTVFVCASGNDGLLGFRTINTPATANGAVAVGATAYMRDYIAEFSSRGPAGFYNLSVKPDVVAPGERIVSTYYSFFGGYGYAALSGTSMATPHVSGTVALMLQANRNLTPEDVREVLGETSIDLGIKGPDYVYGWGRVSALSAVLEVINKSNLSIPVKLFAGFRDVASPNESVNVVAVSWGTAPVRGVNVTFHAEYNGSVVANSTTTTDDLGVARFLFTPEYAGDYRITVSDEFENVVAGNLSVSEGNKLTVIPHDYFAYVNSTLKLTIPVLFSNLTLASGVANVVLCNTSGVALNVSLNFSGNINLTLNLSNTEFDDRGWSGDIFLKIGKSNFYAGTLTIAKSPYEVRLIPWGMMEVEPGKNLTFIVHAFDPVSNRPYNSSVVNVSVTWVLDRIYEKVSDSEWIIALSELKTTSLINETEIVRVPLRHGVGIFSITVPENAYLGLIETDTDSVLVRSGYSGLWKSSLDGDGIIETGAKWNCIDRCTVTVYATLGNESRKIKNESVYFYTLSGNVNVSRTNEYGVAFAKFENVSGNFDILIISGKFWGILETSPCCNFLHFKLNGNLVNLTAMKKVFLQVYLDHGPFGTETVFSGLLNESDNLSIGLHTGDYEIVVYDGNEVFEKRIIVRPVKIDVNMEMSVLRVRSEFPGILYVLVLQGHGIETRISYNTTELILPVDIHSGNVRYFVGFSGENASFVLGSDTIWFDVVYGDVDGDGVITSGDAYMLAEMLIGTAELIESADITMDGRVDVSDLVKLMYYLWGILGI